MSGRIYQEVERLQSKLDELTSYPVSYKEWVALRPSSKTIRHEYNVLRSKVEHEQENLLKNFKFLLEKEFFTSSVKQGVKERVYEVSCQCSTSRLLVDITNYYRQYSDFILKCIKGYTQVTALVPAYNEEKCIGKTIESLLTQTVPFAEIIVINDCSTDLTAEVAASYKGVKVLTPSKNGGKAEALNYGIEHVQTEYFLTIDADTILTPTCVEYMVPHMLNPKIGIVCGYVLPREITTLWERGRFIEYIIGQGLSKKAQARIKSILIAAGCCSLYRTQLVRQVGGYSERTITEDLDLTWTIYEEGYLTRFEQRAKCFSLEPKSLKVYLKQLDRWDRGALQNMKIHSLRARGRLKGLFILYLIEAFLTPILGIVVVSFFPLSKIFLSLFLYTVVDLLFAGTLATIIRWESRKEVWKYIPSYLIVRPLNMFAYARALYKEYIRKEKLVDWVKGH